jgi:hypothetical protein
VFKDHNEVVDGSTGTSGRLCGRHVLRSQSPSLTWQVERQDMGQREEQQNIERVRQRVQQRTGTKSKVEKLLLI